MQHKRQKLLYLVSEDWFFCSHFIERAVAAQKAGYEVVVMTHIDQHADIIRARGLRVIPSGLDRASTNPLKELSFIAQVYRIYRSERPDIVHHVALKLVIYGTIAALMAGVQCMVNAPVGMGFVFISSSFKARILRLPVKIALRLLLNPPRSRVIFENKDDLNALVTDGYVRGNDVRLIRGAGIDLQTYMPVPEQEGEPIIVLVARMLWDKGVGEFVAAARRVRELGYKARFLLVGSPDPLNHATISEAILRGWQEKGIIEWLGHRTDIPFILSKSHIACLPSYREGLPKSLLEALASGRPVVTTDVHGCREVVDNGQNGLLVPVKNVEALAQALITLIKNPGLRASMGAAGRMRAETEFSQERIISETLAVYRDTLNHFGALSKC